MKYLIITCVLLLISAGLQAQTAEDYAIELTATVQESPAQITLKWKLLSTGTPTYHIWKKAKNDVLWGTEIAALPSTANTYTDAAVIIDSAYEYQVFTSDVWPPATGYIYAGIRNPAIHNRGTMILLVDSTFTDSCKGDITTLMNDLSGDGWEIVRHDLARTLPDYSVKAIIANDYATHTDASAVLILGHITVPYSGNYTADHINHAGAYPADVYYTCLTGTFTDATETNITADYLPNHNIPGDGKWDQSKLPAPALMQISRVDFANMYFFPTSEVQMMRTYLAKDHNYKMDSLYVRHRALINDNFGAFGGEAFAANGWRNFSPLLSQDSVAELPFISSLASSSYQWAFGCGGGTFVSASGVGTTIDFRTSPVNGIFMLLFGSFFGDWDEDNDFLRAPLCSANPALTSCWTGRPNWFFHHMALGENIGYSALLAQNNDSVLYQPGNATPQYMHIALMGDGSLRTNYIQPASAITIAAGYLTGAAIAWAASPDTAVIGYYVYRTDSAYGHYECVSPLITTTTWTDATGTNGLKYYMVRPVTLQATPSGRYYNLGIGITDTATVSYMPFLVHNNIKPVAISLFPNPACNVIQATINVNRLVDATISIVNAAGSSEGVQKKQLSPGDNKFSFNVAALPSGIYMLVVHAGNESSVQKWEKL